MASKRAGRRGNGEGSITEERQLPNGDKVFKWAIRVTLPTGERKRIKGTYEGRSITEAREQMWTAKRRHESGEVTAPSAQMTVSDLIDEWMRRERQQAGLSPRTLQIQNELIAGHIRPRMGTWKVAVLTPTLIEEFHIRLKDETTLERSRTQIHTVLRQALNYAVRRKYISINPAASITVPQRQERRRRAARTVSAWTPEQAGVLERAALADGTPLGIAIAFALRTGLRRGELFGLRWQDVDLEAGTLRIEQVLATYGPRSRTLTEPKNEASRRTIPLTAGVVELLHRLRALQEEKRKPDQPEPVFVFTTRKGEMQHPNSMNRKLKQLCERLKIPVLPVHALRHTMVSVAAHQGHPIKQVSAYIGHKNTLVTEAVYWHQWPEHQATIELNLE